MQNVVKISEMESQPYVIFTILEKQLKYDNARSLQIANIKAYLYNFFDICKEFKYHLYKDKR